MFERGHRLRPQDLALLTACGHSRVLVHRSLSVAVLSTGDEISEVGTGRVTAGGTGAVYDSNRPDVAGSGQADGVLSIAISDGCRMIPVKSGRHWIGGPRRRMRSSRPAAPRRAMKIMSPACFGTKEPCRPGASRSSRAAPSQWQSGGAARFSVFPATRSRPSFVH